MEICDLVLSVNEFPFYELGLIPPLTHKGVMKIN